MELTYHQQYYLNNKENWVRDTDEKKELHRQANKKYANKSRENRSAYEQSYWASRWEEYLWKQSKRRAQRAGLDFDIEIEDVVIPKYCPYLGTEITKIFGQGVVWTNPSIDRIDNTKGYVKGNVQILSRRANSVKQDLSLSELQIFCSNVLVQLGKASVQEGGQI